MRAGENRTGEGSRNPLTTSTEQLTNQHRRVEETQEIEATETQSRENTLEQQLEKANASIKKWSEIIDQPKYWFDQKEKLTHEAQEDFTFWQVETERVTTQSQQDALESQEKEKLLRFAAASSQAAQKAEEFLQLLEIQNSFVTRINNPPECFHINYSAADDARRNRDEAWNVLYTTVKNGERIQAELDTREQQLEEAQLANETQEQNDIGRMANAGGTIGAVLAGIPTPVTAVPGAILSTGSGILGFLNQMAGLFRLTAAQVFHEECKKISEEHSAILNESRQNILQLARQTAELEETALKQERIHCLSFSEKLKPQHNWNLNSWQAWHHDMEFSWPEAYLTSLQQNMNCTQQMLSIAWKENINDLKKALNCLTQERTKTLATLNSSYRTAQSSLEKIIDQITQLEEDLKQKSRDKDSLKNSTIPTLTERVVSLQNDPFLANAQQELIDAIALENELSQSITQIESRLAEAIDQKKTAESHLQITSLGCYYFENEHSPVHQLHRLKTRLEGAQEALWSHWPEYDDDVTSRPYLHWPLPFPEDLKEELYDIDTTLPIELEEKKEERGYLFYKEIEHANYQALNPEQPNPKQSQDLYQELISWNSNFINHYFQLKAIDPTAAEQTPHAQRWNAYKAYLQFHQQADIAAHALSQEYANTHSDNETRSVTHSLWSSLVGGPTTPSQLNKQFQYNYQNEQIAFDKWRELMAKANNERVTEGRTSFGQVAWEEADQKTIKEITKREQLLEAKRLAREQQDHWKLLNDCLQAKRNFDNDLWRELMQSHPKVVTAQQVKEVDNTSEEEATARKKEKVEQVLTDYNKKHEKFLECWDNMVAHLNGAVSEEERVQQQLQQPQNCEEKHLTQLERLWKNIIDAQKKKRLTQAEEAATAYHEQGVTSLWNHLPQNLRREYNHWVTEKNSHYSITRGKAVCEREFDFIQQIRNQLESEYNKLISSYSARIGERMLGTLPATILFLEQGLEYCDGQQVKLFVQKIVFERKQELTGKTAEEKEQFSQNRIQIAIQLKKEIESDIDTANTNMSLHKGDLRASSAFSKLANAYKHLLKAFCSRDFLRANRCEYAASFFKDAASDYRNSTRHGNNSILWLNLIDPLTSYYLERAKISEQIAEHYMSEKSPYSGQFNYRLEHYRLSEIIFSRHQRMAEVEEEESRALFYNELFRPSS